MTYLSMYINKKNEMRWTRGRPLDLMYIYSIAKITAAYLQVLLSKHRPLSRHGETLVTPKEPINKRRAEDEKEDRSRIVHVFSRDRQVRRERQPDDDEDEEADSIDIDGVSPSSERERTPGRLPSSDLVDEERAHDLEVRGAQCEVVERQYGVDGRCGGDVDEHEQEYDCQNKAESVQRDAKSRVSNE
jgi:hypothetical protein